MFRNGSKWTTGRKKSSSDGSKSQRTYSEKRPPTERHSSHIKDGIWTCEREVYQYPIEESPKDPWERCYDAVDKSDADLCADIRKEISDLLLVATLFLGIVTAFAIQSFTWLRANEVSLLKQLVLAGNNSTTSESGDGSDTSVSGPLHFEVVVNQFWFLSMILSLAAVVAGTLCLQWLSAFRCTDVKHLRHDDALALRQLRHEGFIAWGVPRVPAILLLTVQASLVLFAIGLLYLLWHINRAVALPVAIVSGMSVALLAMTTFAPLLQSILGWIFPKTMAAPQCPYKSPISWLFHRAAVLLAVTCTLPLICLPYFENKLSGWHQDQCKLLTDYLWRRFDELWRKQRELRGPQSEVKQADSESTGPKAKVPYSYYLVKGLASAMESLVFKPSAVAILHTCLQEFHGTSVEIETFETLYEKDFTKAEELLLRDSTTESGKGESSSIRSLRKDFLNAQALQHFVKNNRNLHRILLPHRTELYIRIKNSARALTPPQVYNPELSEDQKRDSKHDYIGVSVECPVHNLRDAQHLAPELRIQFLKCAEQLVGTGQFNDEDTYGAALVLKVSQDELSGSVMDDDDDESSIEHTFRRVLTALDKRLSEQHEDHTHINTHPKLAEILRILTPSGPIMTNDPVLNSPTAMSQPDDSVMESPLSGSGGDDTTTPAAPAMTHTMNGGPAIQSSPGEPTVPSALSNGSTIANTPEIQQPPSSPQDYNVLYDRVKGLLEAHDTGCLERLHSLEEFKPQDRRRSVRRPPLGRLSEKLSPV